MKRFSFILLILLGFGTVACQPASQLESQQANQTQKAKGIWLDVRSPEEFSQGHLEGALNVPHKDIAAQIAQISPNKNEPIHLYCRSGRRAEEALQTLKDLGYTNLTNHGGYEELLKKGIR